MEFHEKLQELRKRKGITQEELAAALYVSRPAVSKWESGRGYPGIDSLKAIAQYYAVTIDELLSAEELLTAAGEDQSRKETKLRSLIFGLLDLSSAMLFLLPVFGQQTADAAEAVSLWTLNAVAPYLRITYVLLLTVMVLAGVLNLVLRPNDHVRQLRLRYGLTFVPNAAAVLLFIISRQPYAAVYLLVLLAVKVMILLKQP